MSEEEADKSNRNPQEPKAEKQRSRQAGTYAKLRLPLSCCDKNVRLSACVYLRKCVGKIYTPVALKCTTVTTCYGNLPGVKRKSCAVSPSPYPSFRTDLSSHLMHPMSREVAF